LLKQLLAAFVDFCCASKLALAASRIELRFLNLLRKIGTGRRGIARFRLFEFAFALFAAADKSAFSRIAKQLAFLNAAAALNRKFLYGRRNLGHNHCLLQRKHHCFGGHYLFNRSFANRVT